MKKDQLKIETLDLLADLFWFPDEDWFYKLERLKEFKPELKIPDISLQDLESFYIYYFDLNSSKFNTSLLASVWLDGKMMGESTVEIEQFYKDCGYIYDREGPADHLSNLLVFYAILLEDKKYEEAKEFRKYFSWLNEFDQALQVLKEPVFGQLIKICKELI